MPLLIYVPVDPTERYDLVKAHPCGVQLQRIGTRVLIANIRLLVCFCIE